MRSFFGFSTGALALSDFSSALELMAGHQLSAVELSALRLNELSPLLHALSTLDLRQFTKISVHAPSRFSATEEPGVVSALSEFALRGWPIVLHPDAICDFALWQGFGSLLLIENMDKRKPVGRTASELSDIFDRLPEARLCFDIAHARQYDGTMVEAHRILTTLGDRVAQVHISEVSSRSSHERISRYAVLAFRNIARLIPEDIPVIIESRIAPELIDIEVAAARRALEPVSAALQAA